MRLKTELTHNKVVGTLSGMFHSNSTNTNFTVAGCIHNAKSYEGFGEWRGTVLWSLLCRGRNLFTRNPMMQGMWCFLRIVGELDWGGGFRPPWFMKIYLAHWGKVHDLNFSTNSTKVAFNKSFSLSSVSFIIFKKGIVSLKIIDRVKDHSVRLIENLRA